MAGTRKGTTALVGGLLLVAWPYPLAAEGDDIVLKLDRNTWLVVELIAEHVTGEWSVETRFPGIRSRPIPRNERLVWMPVRPGQCTFSVELPGQPPIKQSIEIFPGETRRVRIPTSSEER